MAERSTRRRGWTGFLCLAALGAGAAACAHRAPHASAGTLRIFLARHGQTDWNAQRRMQGQTDIPLNETGRRQAAELAKRFEGVPLDAVYCSALGRSRETAEIARGGAPLTALPGLNEQSVGAFEGLRLDGSEPERAAEYERRKNDPGDALDGGESEIEFFQRVRTTVAEILARHDEGTILIVGHGGTNQMVLRAILGLTADQGNGVRQANDELYLIEYEAGRPPRLWKSITDANLAEL